MKIRNKTNRQVTLPLRVKTLVVGEFASWHLKRLNRAGKENRTLRPHEIADFPYKLTEQTDALLLIQRDVLDILSDDLVPLIVHADGSIEDLPLPEPSPPDPDPTPTEPVIEPDRPPSEPPIVEVPHAVPTVTEVDPPEEEPEAPVAAPEPPVPVAPPVMELAPEELPEVPPLPPLPSLPSTEAAPTEASTDDSLLCPFCKVFRGNGTRGYRRHIATCPARTSST